MSLSQEMLQQKVWAVVGATTDRTKYGYKLYKKLKSNGYTVYPVNPGYDSIEGETCYAALGDLPVKPEVIDMVVNPRISRQVVDEAAELQIDKIWFQPGTFNDPILAACEEKGIRYVTDCVLTALR